MSVCPPGYQWHHSLEKQRLPLLSLIDSLGSALRVAAQPDLLRRASAFLRSQRAPGNNPVSLPFPANSVYLLTLREAMKAALTDKQSYDVAFMSGLDFFLSLSLLAFLPPSRMSQSVVSPFSLAMGPVDTGIRHSSHWGEWDMLVAITIHEAVWSTLSPVVSKRCLSAPPLPLLSLSARGG